MPVIVNSKCAHPFLPSLGSLTAIEKERAERQDIRPLEIAVINLMADKRTTERQLANWLGHTPLQIRLTFAGTDSYIHAVQNGKATTHTPSDHVRSFYSAWSDIKANKYDGLIVTGVNALEDRVEKEKIWPEVEAILEWSETNVLSSLFLCWGAKAALKKFYGIDSLKQKEKIWGVFPHTIGSDKTDLLFGLPDVFDLPVSRWKTPLRADILRHPELEIVADSAEVGPNILVESAPLRDSIERFPRRIFMLGHPEYETDTLRGEYERDRNGNAASPLPQHYFPKNDPSSKPVNTWRSCAYIYSNWVHAVYNATPYDIAAIPSPHASPQRNGILSPSV